MAVVSTKFLVQIVCPIGRMGKTVETFSCTLPGVLLKWFFFWKQSSFDYNMNFCYCLLEFRVALILVGCFSFNPSICLDSWICFLHRSVEMFCFLFDRVCRRNCVWHLQCRIQTGRFWFKTLKKLLEHLRVFLLIIRLEFLLQLLAVWQYFDQEMRGDKRCITLD